MEIISANDRSLHDCDVCDDCDDYGGRNDSDGVHCDCDDHDDPNCGDPDDPPDDDRAVNHAGRNDCRDDLYFRADRRDRNNSRGAKISSCFCVPYAGYCCGDRGDRTAGRGVRDDCRDVHRSADRGDRTGCDLGDLRSRGVLCVHRIHRARHILHTPRDLRDLRDLRNLREIPTQLQRFPSLSSRLVALHWNRSIRLIALDRSLPLSLR